MRFVLSEEAGTAQVKAPRHVRDRIVSHIRQLLQDDDGGGFDDDDGDGDDDDDGDTDTDSNGYDSESDPFNAPSVPSDYDSPDVADCDLCTPGNVYNDGYMYVSGEYWGIYPYYPYICWVYTPVLSSEVTGSGQSVPVQEFVAMQNRYSAVVRVLQQECHNVRQLQNEFKQWAVGSNDRNASLAFQRLVNETQVQVLCDNLVLVNSTASVISGAPRMFGPQGLGLGQSSGLVSLLLMLLLGSGGKLTRLSLLSLMCMWMIAMFC